MFIDVEGRHPYVDSYVRYKINAANTAEPYCRTECVRGDKDAGTQRYDYVKDHRYGSGSGLHGTWDRVCGMGLQDGNAMWKE